MRKSLVFLTILGLVAALSPVSAAKPADVGGEPAPIAGTFAVPGRPDLKVRVFVHGGQPVKPDNPGSNGNGKNKPDPEPEPEPELICDIPDVDSEAVVDHTGWQLPTNTQITYRVNPDSAPSSITPDEFSTLVDRSFDAWQNEIPGVIDLQRGDDTNTKRSGFDGENILAFGRIQGSALGVTRVWYYTATGNVAEVDTLLNQKFAWEWTDQETDPGCALQGLYDAQAVMTHEIGHWYGLDDHYTAEYVNNTMYGYGYQTDIKDTTPTTGDIAGLNAIYP